MVRFVTGMPALIHRKTLFVADVHAGVEFELWKRGVRILDISDRIISLFDRLFSETKPKKLIIAGDFKHNIPSTFVDERVIVKIYEFVSTQGEVLIVKGNHDGRLEEIIPGAEVFPPSGIREGTIYVFHGHAWPSEDFVDSQMVICGHTHPAIEIKHEFGSETVKCFLHGYIEERVMLNRYGVDVRKELLCIPAFSPVITGYDILKRVIGVFGDSLVMEDVFLLDGTKIF